MMQSKYVINPGHLLLVLLAILFYLPISLNFIHVSGRPIDFTFSDVCVVLLLFLYFHRVIVTEGSKLEKQLILFISSVLLFFLILAMIGSLEAESLVPLFSVIKYVKPFFAILAGMCFAHFCSFVSFWCISATASFFVVVSLSITQFIQLQSFLPRWGEFIFGAPVYGFPNMPAQYYLLLLMFLTVGRLRGYFVLPYFVASILIGLFMVLSLSRGGLVVLIVFLIFMYFFVCSLKKRLVSALGIILLIPFLFAMSDPVINSLSEIEKVSRIFSALENRIDRTFDKDRDPTSGRVDIAIEVVGLVSNKPLLGYKFDSFSNYDRHATAHNQYLEALFKTGLLGMTIYFFVLFIFVWLICRKSFARGVDRNVRENVLIFICALGALMIGCVTQPNFTYSQTGNVVFFMLGYIVIVKFPVSTVNLLKNNINDQGVIPVSNLVFSTRENLRL